MGVVTAHRKAASVNKHQGISVRFFVRIIYPYRNRPDGAFHLCIDNFERLGPALVPEFTYTSVCGAQIEADPVGGYRFVFITCMAAMALGLVCAVISDRLVLKYRKTPEYQETLKEG